MGSRLNLILSDEQTARVICATGHFNVRPVGFFPNQAALQVVAIKKRGGTSTGQKNKLRKHMAALTRKVAGELDAVADGIVNKEIIEECSRLQLRPPVFNADWNMFISRGLPVITPTNSTPSQKVAINIVNRHISLINNAVANSPKRKMKPIMVKLR